jgi:mannosyltransferase
MEERPLNISTNFEKPVSNGDNWDKRNYFNMITKKLKPILENKLVQLSFIFFFANFIFKLFFLTDYGIWYDECFSIFHSQKGLKQIADVSRWDYSPPFYYYILHFWMKFFGITENSARILNILISSISGGLLFAFTFKHFNKVTAYFSSILFLTSNILFFYAQETRSYTLIILLFLASSFLFFELYKTKKWIFAVALGVINYLIILSHYLYGLIFLFQFILVLSYFNRKTLTQFISAVIITLVLFNKWILHAYKIFLSGGTKIVQPPSFRDIYPNILPLFNDSNSLALILILIGSIGLIVYILKKNKSDEEKRLFSFNLIYILLLSIGTIVIFFVISNKTPIFTTRYLVPSMAGMLILFPYLFSQIKISKTIQISTIVIVFLIAINSMNFKINKGMNYKHAIPFIKSHKGDKTAVVLQSIDMMSLFAYYYDKNIFKDYNFLDFNLVENNIFPANDSTWFKKYKLNAFDTIILAQTFAEYTDPNRTTNLYLDQNFERGETYFNTYDGIKISFYLNSKPDSIQSQIKDNQKSEHQKKIDFYVNKIKEDINWLSAIEKKSKKKNLPLDSMILLDAIWMVDNEAK